jgi:hypothetical protein
MIVVQRGDVADRMSNFAQFRQTNNGSAGAAGIRYRNLEDLDDALRRPEERR